GFAIGHEPRMVVLHAAPQYTSLGRRVLRRERVASAAWVESLRGEHPDAFLARASLLQRQGLMAEAGDCLRAAALWHPGCDFVRAALAQLQARLGGAVDGSAWRPAADAVAAAARA